MTFKKVVPVLVLLLAGIRCREDLNHPHTAVWGNFSIFDTVSAVGGYFRSFVQTIESLTYARSALTV
ncbi:MAG TPA: hypothetical protein VE135_09125 [Pyrinomonadaceae bacterium]|nr:hypothetical protein [Pyrinomonadaceae bacterium]